MAASGSSAPPSCRSPPTPARWAPGSSSSSSLKSQSASNQQANLQAAAAFEAGNAAPKFLGTINTTVTPAADFSYVTVKLTSQAPGYLNKLTSLFPPFTTVAPPLLSATATVTLKGGPKPCVLTLGTSGIDIEVDGSGVLAATSCPIFSNSSGAPSIHASGSGQFPSPAPSADRTSQPWAPLHPTTAARSPPTPSPRTSPKPPSTPWPAPPPPTPGTCGNGQSDYTGSNNGQPWPAIPPQTWCNVNVNLGGNGNTIQLQPGVFYIVNGNLTFGNANVTLSAASVSSSQAATPATSPGPTTPTPPIRSPPPPRVARLELQSG